MVSMPADIGDLNDFDESINMLVYADSGVGKTVFAGTAGERGLFLSTETGTISAARQGSKAKVWRVNHWDDLIRAYKYLEAGGHENHDWVLLDSLTAMQVKSMDAILEQAVAANSNRDPDVPAIQDYQKNQRQTLKMIRRFNDLPINVCWTALTYRTEDEEAEPLVLPLLTGKGYGVAQQACGEMNLVGYLGIKTPKDEEPFRRLLFQATPPYFAKDRYNIGRWLDNPTIPEIEALIAGTEPPANKTSATKGRSRRTSKSTTAAASAAEGDDD